jgi:hypothetical protein
MSRLQIPVTATNLPEWIRRCADAVNSIMTRLVSLETQPYRGASLTLTPATLPASPDVGMTVMDSADGVVKTWDGATWRAHY